MDNLQPLAVRSSMIAAASYDPDARELIVTFSGNGARWKYSGVSQDAVDQLEAAPSQGRFFLTEIKGMYPEQRV